MLTNEERVQLFNAVHERVHQAAIRGSELFREDIEEIVEIDIAQGRFESPIEAMFAAWWLALEPHYLGREVSLVPQTDVVIDGEQFRLDFTVALGAHPGTFGSGVFNPYPKVVIELDGHDFHERTKEQVTYRNQRDRALQGAGWKVLHVSGSELWRTPETCVSELMKLVSWEFVAFWTEYWEGVKGKQGR